VIIITKESQPLNDNPPNETATENVMKKKSIIISIILSTALMGQAAQAGGRSQLSAGQNQSQVGLLLPAVQSVRDAAPDPQSASTGGNDLLIVNNGDGSDFTFKSIFGRVTMVRIQR